MEKKYNELSKIQLGTIDFSKKSIINSSDIIIENIKNGKLANSSFGLKLNGNSIQGSIRILDVGSSHGRNSITVLNLIISNILKHFPNQCFEILHEDLPENDFSLLFNEIIKNENSYLKLSNQIFYYGIGNSCYNQVVPSNSIDLCFSFSTSHWSPYNEKYHYDKDSIAVMYKVRSDEYRQFCIETLYNFLSLRSNELKSGGSFVCSLLHENNSITPEFDSFYHLFIKIKTVWKQMANENLIDIDIVNKMILNWNVYKEDEVKEVLKMLEINNKLKLVSIEQKTQKTKNTVSGNSDDEIQINFYIQMTIVVKNILKAFIPGDENHRESLFQIFNSKFIDHMKQNPIKNLGNIYSYFIMVFEKEE
ncbi:hypothetical protein ACTA71_012685 [Dictyostelium dimigraforme]